MALNFKKLKSTLPSLTGAKVTKFTQNNKGKTMKLEKIKILKDKISNPFDFRKITKLNKIPKIKQVSLIKKTIKKNVGY